MPMRVLLMVCLTWCVPALVQGADGGWLEPGQQLIKLEPVLTQKGERSAPIKAIAGTRVIWPRTASAMQQASTPTERVHITRKWAPAGGAAFAAAARGARDARANTRSNRLTPQMQQSLLKAADHFGVDAYLIKAVIHAESAFNPLAVSHKNAIGLMQVLPGTAREMGLHEQGQMSVEQLLMDPRVSIAVGTRYLAEQLRHFGSVDLALAAYNAGPGAVRRSGNRVPNYPETKAYVQRVKALQGTYSRARSLEGPELMVARQEVGP